MCVLLLSALYLGMGGILSIASAKQIEINLLDISAFRLLKKCRKILYAADVTAYAVRAT